MTKGAWNYRHFIYSSIKAELNGRYSRSKLGGAWLILNPLAQALVLAIVLSQLVGSRLSGIESDYAYAIYLLSGTLAWNFFSEMTITAISMFRDRGNLLKKINFPRVCIPIIVVSIALINHLILMMIIVLIVWLLGVPPTEYLLYLPLLVLVNLSFALGIGLILSVFDVFVRDIGHFWQVIIGFWFWLTPIVYVEDILPPIVSNLMKFNPMYWVTNGYQQVIAYGHIPDLTSLGIIAIIGFFLLVFGFILFLRASSDIVDAL